MPLDASPLDPDDLVALHQAGLSDNAICRHLNIGHDRLLKEVAGLPPKPKNSLRWNAEAKAYLAEWAGKIPYSKIAEHLGVTRNAVIGEAFRIGLCNQPPPAPKPQLTDADFRGCRFIAGDGTDLRPGMYCCAPTPVGSAWCPEHRALCYRQAEERVS